MTDILDSLSPQIKHCPGAGDQLEHDLPVTAFAADRSRVDGKAPYCRKCAATKQREWRQRHPEKVKELRQKYKTPQAAS